MAFTQAVNEMGFELTKISNYGTTHPVVARLKVQTGELIQWADLTKEREESIVAIYFDMADRLLKCHEVHERLLAAREKSIAEFKPTSDSRVKTAPHVIGLKGEAETFLYESKNFLRDLLGAVRVFFGTNFDEASAFYSPKGGNGKLAEWATAKFGQNDPFTTMLISEQTWTGELIRMRNAAEHPGGKSGTLHIDNFQTLPDGRYATPSWHRDKNAPTDIFTDLGTFLANMLTLAEDILVSCIVHNSKHKFIQFYEIPEKDRRPECPVRISVTLSHAAMGSPKPAS
jgi:hypothetical protein